MTETVSRATSCTVACAEVWRDAGEVMASPFGTIPALGARLARATFSPTWCSLTARPPSWPAPHPSVLAPTPTRSRRP